jgi:hypothetical protein
MTANSTSESDRSWANTSRTEQAYCASTNFYNMQENCQPILRGWVDGALGHFCVILNT